MKKRLLGILLSFALMLTMMPVLGLSLTAYAADYETIEITDAVYDETSVSTLINSLDGFSKLSSEEAESWEPPTRSGNERLIYDYEGENNNICVAMFENGNFLGNATISLGMAQYPGIKYYYAKKTVVAVNSVTLSPATAQSINVGGSVAFTATVAPDGATDKTVKWSTTGGVTLYSDENCTAGNEIGADATETLTVYAKGVSAGSAKVTVTSNADSTKTASCAVTVNEAATGVKYLDADGNEQSCESYTVVDANTKTWGEAGKTNWYVVKDTVTINDQVTFKGDVNLILCDDAKLTVNAVDSGDIAIEVDSGSTLTVYAQSVGDSKGQLIANSNNYIGIYGKGNITINGGMINSTGSGGCMESI